MGRRIYKSSSNSTSVFAYDGDNLIEEANTSGAVAGGQAFEVILIFRVAAPSAGGPAFELPGGRPSCS
jgi:hypothetical protein